MWNGTLATLKPKPTTSSPVPSTARVAESGESAASERAIRSREVLPVTP